MTTGEAIQRKQPSEASDDRRARAGRRNETKVDGERDQELIQARGVGNAGERPRRESNNIIILPHRASTVKRQGGVADLPLRAERGREDGSIEPRIKLDFEIKAEVGRRVK